MLHRKIGPKILKMFLLISVLTALLTFSSPLVLASEDIWAIHNQAKRESDVLKPVDPIFFNEKGGTISVDLGEEWSFFYPLEAGKRYHVFLVGEWVKNTTDPVTDYDVRTYDPNGKWLSDHTESAGIPEQVANDEHHQYFVPERTGKYKFKVINDLRDSKNDEPAILMVIEHIDVNVRYTRYLMGRDEKTDEPLLLTSWAYALNASSHLIHVFVEVPDSLDMYEVRLYAMANHDEGVGYLIDGLGVPSGDLFNNFVGEYGGFNTSCKGDRNIEAMDSCEYSGQDMEFVYETPNDESNIFYYIVLIAEHGEGTVEFYAQTDFSPANITLLDPPEKGYATEETPIAVSVDDDSEIQRVWVDYTDDGGETLETEELTLEGDLYVCDLPPFPSGVYVNYTVYAKDVVGNVGSIDAGFTVKNKVTLDCSIADSKVKVSQNVVVSGTASTPSTVILQFKNEGAEQSIEVLTDSSGFFRYIYETKKPGEWSLQALFNGDELHYPASSDMIDFMVERQPLRVDCALSSSEVKKSSLITVSGKVTPPVAGLDVEVTFTSSTAHHKETVVTDADGCFSCDFEPQEADVWNILAQVKGGVLYTSPQSGLMEVLVTPLSSFDRVTGALSMLVKPPYQYLVIGLTGIGVSLTVYMTRSRLGILSKVKVKRRKGKKAQKYKR